MKAWATSGQEACPDRRRRRGRGSWGKMRAFWAPGSVRVEEEARRTEMATQAAVPGRAVPWWMSKTAMTIGLLAVLGIALRFVLHYALPYFRFDPAYYDYLWPRRTRLIVHICGGMPAVLLGPLQFWTGLRQKAMGVHRWIGRIYLVGVCVGATGALLMTRETTPRSFGVSLMGLATAWLGTTGFAYAAIVRGKVALHKEWMVRSYVVTFAFVLFRVISDGMPWLASRLGNNADDAAGNIAWLSWVLPLAVYEVILQWRRLFPARVGVGARA